MQQLYLVQYTIPGVPGTAVPGAAVPDTVYLVQWVFQPPLKTLAPSLSLRPAAAFIKIYSRRQLRPSGGSSLGLIY